jgi:hypothetical protein
MILRYGIPVFILLSCIIGIVTNGLPGLVTALLLDISGGVVAAVMYFGTREQHDENVSDQPHA